MKRKIYRHPFLIMSGLYIGAFVGMYSETSLNIALPELSKTFGLPISTIQLLVVGYMMIIGIVLPFASLLMKTFKVKTLTLFSLTSFFIGSILSSAAPNFGLLLTGRMIQGIGTGLILPILFALTMEVFPIQKLGAAMGMAALIIMFAPAVGPTLAGILLSIASWRLIFASFAVFLAIAWILAFNFIESPFELTKPKIDLLSTITSALGFGGIVLGFSLASEYSFQSPIVVSSLVIGLIALIIYVARQLKMAHPILNLKALANPGFLVGTLLVMINFGITLSAMFLLPQYLQNGLLLPVDLTGMIMLPGGILNAVVSFASGKLYDKMGPKVLVPLGFIFTLVGAFLFSRFSTDTPIAYVIFCHLLLMIGIPLSMSPAQSSGLSALPPHLSTDGSTIINTFQQVIGAICTALTTCLLQLGQSANAQTSQQAFVNGTHMSTYFVIGLAILGLILSFFVRSPQKQVEMTQEIIPENN